MDEIIYFFYFFDINLISDYSYSSVMVYFLLSCKNGIVNIKVKKMFFKNYFGQVEKIELYLRWFYYMIVKINLQYMVNVNIWY